MVKQFLVFQCLRAGISTQDGGPFSKNKIRLMQKRVNVEMATGNACSCR